MRGLVWQLLVCVVVSGGAIACSSTGDGVDIVQDAVVEVDAAAPIADVPVRPVDDVTGRDDDFVPADLTWPDGMAEAGAGDADAAAELVDAPADGGGTDVWWEVLEPAPDVADVWDVEDGDVKEVWSEDAAPGDVEPDTGPAYAWQPEQPCGMPAYEWLPADQVGHPVEWKENLLYNLPPVLIEELVAEAGYNLTLPLEYTTRVFEMRYTTQDRGVVREATAMVGFPVPPESMPGDDAFPTALFLHGTTGFADKCAPSHGLEGAAAAVLPAAAGFVAVAPDFLGLCGVGDPCPEMFHPYLIGEPTAVASLDAVRAAHELLGILQDELGIAADNRVVSWGASQGGHAALFVQRYAPHYAPELDIPCVLAIVPPADLLGQEATALTSLSSAAKLGIAFLTAAWFWYEPTVPVTALFNPDGPKDYSDYIPETFLSACSANSLVKGAKKIEDVFAAPFLEGLLGVGLEALEPWGCYVAENSLPTTSVPYASQAQVYFVLGQNDNLVDVAIERESFAALCDQGYQMEYTECAGLGHTDAALQTAGMQIEWALQCLAGDGIDPASLCLLKEPEVCVIE